MALCLGTYGSPRGVGVSYERGTPVPAVTDIFSHNVDLTDVFPYHAGMTAVAKTDVTENVPDRMDVTEILRCKVGVTGAIFWYKGGRADGDGGRADQPLRGALPTMDVTDFVSYKVERD